MSELVILASSAAGARVALAQVDKEIRNYAETGGKQPAAGDKYPPAVQKVLEDTAVQQLLMQMKSAPDEAQARQSPARRPCR